ncbi:heterogeneous nuclear ribonucleoprotein A2 homolog 1-like isoform X1 [Daphnia carinata]|uniref:heterogeneous nuclear ribonucleoprotein A2 homolog 1-like isoform X1 n=1 Tax=Daphnia carinata TaxID=120202 RepID=UPI002868CDE6|nr:heterogeneous nuclear ribonucleoprotein A2 homolog 1-like isoform X1 [Daphnia carinata]
MDRITIICFLFVALTAVMSSARPSVYGYGKDYSGAEYGGYGFIDYQVPRYGSGYDKYIYGNYEGHAVNYDYSKIQNSYHGGNKAYLQTPYGYGGPYGKY